MIEVERKAWTRDPKGLEKEVRKIAKKEKEGRKCDYYYASTDELDPIRNCFRIRQDGDKSWVTFKDRRIRNRSEINRETEVPIRNPVLWAGLFESIGFRMFVRKEKQYRIYRYRREPGLAIEINRVSDLGSFVELEMLCRKNREVSPALREIREVFRELRIRDREVEPRLYIEILREKLKGKRYKFHRRARSLESAYSLPGRD